MVCAAIDIGSNTTRVLVAEPVEGQLRKVMVVIKMRGGNHSKDIREYVITDKGVVVIHPRSTEYDGLITGIPKRAGPRPAQKEEAPPEPKARK